MGRIDGIYQRLTEFDDAASGDLGIVNKTILVRVLDAFSDEKLDELCREGRLGSLSNLEFSNWLRAERERLNLSQTELAEELQRRQVNQPDINKIEKHPDKLTMTYSRRLAIKRAIESIGS